MVLNLLILVFISLIYILGVYLSFIKNKLEPVFKTLGTFCLFLLVLFNGDFSFFKTIIIVSLIFSTIGDYLLAKLKWIEGKTKILMTQLGILLFLISYFIYGVGFQILSKWPTMRISLFICLVTFILVLFISYRQYLTMNKVTKEYKVLVLLYLFDLGLLVVGGVSTLFFLPLNSSIPIFIASILLYISDSYIGHDMFGYLKGSEGVIQLKIMVPYIIAQILITFAYIVIL